MLFRECLYRLHSSFGPEFEPKLSVRTISRLIDEHDKMEEQVRMRPSDLRIVLTGTQYGYRRITGCS